MFFGSAPKNSIAAIDMSGESCYTIPGDFIDAKVVKPESVTFNGIAYIAGHGGHIAIIDMRTMKSPTDIE